MGGAVKGIGNAVGDVVGGVGGIASGVAGAIPGIGPYLGPVVGGITGGPLGFATSLGSNALQGNYGGGGGGGGSSAPMYAQPGYNYGNQTYQYGSKPLDTSKYFISGDRGVYNLMPALGQINAGANPRSNTYNPTDSRANRDIIAANAYTPYEAYQDIQSQMANDPRALATFNKAFIPRSGVNIKNNNENSPMNQFQRNTPNPLGQIVNYGLNDRMGGVQPKLGLRYDQIAKYAAENKNPFFMPYETTQGATPLGFTPSADKLGAIDTSQYLSGYNTAQTAQKQYSIQQQAKRAEEDRRRVEKEKIRPDTTRPIIDPARPGSQLQTQPMRPQTQPMAPRMAHGGIAMLRRR
jgi:hypothetical protein